MVGGNSFYRNNVSGVASALFLLPIAGTKEKAKQKENSVEGISPSAQGDQGSAFGNRKPLKRLEPNFKAGVGWLLAKNDVSQTETMSAK